MVAVTDPGTWGLFLRWETPEQLVGGAQEICTLPEEAALCMPVRFGAAQGAARGVRQFMAPWERREGKVLLQLQS